MTNQKRVVENHELKQKIVSEQEANKTMNDPKEIQNNYKQSQKCGWCRPWQLCEEHSTNKNNHPQPLKNWETMLEYALPDKLTEEEKRVIRNNVRNLLCSQPLEGEFEKWEKEFDEKFVYKGNEFGCVIKKDGDAYKGEDIKSFIHSLLHSQKSKLIKVLKEKIEGMKKFTTHSISCKTECPIGCRCPCHSDYDQALKEILSVLEEEERK